MSDIQLKNKSNKLQCAKNWRNKNKDRVKAYNYCSRMGLDWEEYKKENDITKQTPRQTRI